MSAASSSPLGRILGPAAVVHFIDPAQLAERLTAEPSEVAATLLPHVDAERAPDGQVRWTLRPATRRRTLSGADDAMARAWIALGPGAVPTATEHVLRSWLSGNFDAERELHDDGDAVQRVAGWLRDCKWLNPPAEQLLRTIARQELRRHLERTASPVFVGRTRELHELAISLDQAGIAVVEARGGMGKSSLIARLLMDRGAYAAGAPTIIVVDFDDPGISVLEIESLYAEMARQAALQVPALSEFEASFREHASQFRRAASDGDARAARLRLLEDSRLYSLAGFFLDVASSSSQTIIVLDTLERARHVSSVLVDQAIGILRSMIRGLRIALIVSGRGPIDLPSLHAAHVRTVFMLGSKPRSYSRLLGYTSL